MRPPHRYHETYTSVFRIILKGSICLVATIFILLIISCFVFGNTYVIGRIVACGIALLYLLTSGYLAKIGHCHQASLLLVLFYACIAILNLYIWGVNTPFGIILLSITIVLSSILLGSRSTIAIGSGLIVFLLSLQIMISYYNYTPVFSPSLKPSHMGDAIAYSGGLALLVLVSWLYNRQTQKLLQEAESAKADLAQEKDLLEVRVKERTADAKKAQLEETRALYQFVEIGQLSAALIHDLANHLTVLTMDIEDIKQHQHSKVIERAQQSLGNLEKMVSTLRDQLQGKEKRIKFTPSNVIKPLIKTQGDKVHITLIVEKSARQYRVNGDPLRLVQVMTILINNSIEAYDSTAPKYDITIRVQATKHTITVTIQDNGRGLPESYKDTLFKPMQSTKKEGLGVGLFLAKKIIETHFEGTLECVTPKEPTTFHITLPVSE